MPFVNFVRFLLTKRKIVRTLHVGIVSNLKGVCARPFSSETKNEFVWHPEKVVEIPNVPLHSFLFDAMEKEAEKTFMIRGEDDSNYTFLEMREKSLRFSSVLARLGIEKGSTVAIISPNCPEYFVAVIGAISLGSILTPVSPQFTADEITRQLNDSSSCVVICHEDCLKNVKKAVNNVPSFRHLIVIGQEHEGVFSFQKLLDKDDGKGIPSHIDFNSEDVAFLPYSSGTTGLPKGVMLTHANLVANIIQCLQPEILPLGWGRDTSIGVLPFYHIYGLFVNVLFAYKLQVKVVTMKSYNTVSYVDLIEKHKATSLIVVPPIVSALCNDKYATRERLSSVNTIVVAAAPVGPALHDKFANKFGNSIEFFEGFGMTELSPVSNFARRGKFIAGSCGQAIPNTYMKVVDLQTGEPLGPGVEGEVCIKGPQVMKGYWKNPEATKKTISDGWIYTGDIGKTDKNGNLYLVDRLKELIKVKGMQVAPAELEDLLRTHPGVDDVAVIGIPDERAGEVPKAFIVPSKEHPPNEGQLYAFVEDQVAPYKNLKGGISLVAEIPKSPSGKILRRVLKEQNT